MLKGTHKHVQKKNCTRTALAFWFRMGNFRLGVGSKTKIKMKAVPQRNGTTGTGRVCGTDPWWVGQVHLPPLSSRLWCPRGRGDGSNSTLHPVETACTHTYVCVSLYCVHVEHTNYSFSYLSENTSTKWHHFGWTSQHCLRVKAWF